MTGLSMGGTLTLYMAAVYPDIIRGAIPINSSVFVDNPDPASLAFMAGESATVLGVQGISKSPRHRKRIPVEI
jgi:carboxylesterase